MTKQQQSAKQQQMIRYLVRSREGTQRVLTLVKSARVGLGMKPAKLRRYLRELGERARQLDEEIKQARMELQR